ncbi:MAG: nicotinate phosphoribosyltransferase [Bacteroidales bacterium]
MTRNMTLLTDLYEITMAQSYWSQGKIDTDACFYSFYRDNPFGGGYGVFCGANQIAELVDGFGFTDDDIEYLASLQSPGKTPLFDPAFLAWLRGIELSVDICTVPEGSPVFPREPLVRVTGPLLQCQLLEPAILNGVNFQTLIATKASRVCQAAEGRPVSEFGLRRAQGPDGALSSSRAAYVGGCASVANVLAGKLYDIPVSGTHAHSWVMSFPDELSAFRAYARAMPDNCTLLVDTYDVEQGVKNAIIVARELGRDGHKLQGIRIDSGDLAWLSKMARSMLDKAGFSDVGIVLSNDLDEYTITSLNEQRAQYTALGVGTHLAAAYGQPALGGVYKLSAIREPGQEDWTPRLKISEQLYKRTIPGVLDVRRYRNGDGMLVGDLIFDVNDGVPADAVIVDPLDAMRRRKMEGEFETLLKPLVKAGKLEDVDLSARTARTRCAQQLACLDDSIKRFMNPHEYPCGIERGLFKKRDEIVIATRGRDSLYD